MLADGTNCSSAVNAVRAGRIRCWLKRMLLCNRNGIPVRCHHPHLLRSFQFDDLNSFRMIAFFGVAGAVHLISTELGRHHTLAHMHADLHARAADRNAFSIPVREEHASERITILRQKLNSKFAPLSFVVLHLNLILDEAASTSASINNFSPPPSLSLPRIYSVFRFNSAERRTCARIESQKEFMQTKRCGKKAKRQKEATARHVFLASKSLSRRRGTKPE